MSDDTKAREWWIPEDWQHSEEIWGVECRGLIHVVAHSAYEQACKERDELRDRIIEYKKILARDGYTAALVAIKERDEARAELDRISFHGLSAEAQKLMHDQLAEAKAKIKELEQLKNIDFIKAYLNAEISLAAEKARSAKLVEAIRKAMTHRHSDTEACLTLTRALDEYQGEKE